MMNPRRQISIWEIAANAADMTLNLPGGVPLFLRRIAAGGQSFWMGSRGNYSDEEPVHRVEFPKGVDFFLGTFVVTQEQWLAAKGKTVTLRKRRGYPKSPESAGTRYPVTEVSWSDAVAWCAELMLLPGFPSGLVSRLPTEAEWEYACRAGSETEYYTGDGKATLANVLSYNDDSERVRQPVDESVDGRVEEHPYGLFGFHGNVREWCSDAYYVDTYRRQIDCKGAPEMGLRDGDVRFQQLRVVRGGSYQTSASRQWEHPVVRSHSLGFRLCLAPRLPELKGKKIAETEQRTYDQCRRPEVTMPGVSEAGGTGLASDHLQAKPAKT